MAGIEGVGGVQGPKPDRPAGARNASKARGDEQKTTSNDGVVISSEAQAAAKLASLIASASDQPDVRADKVAAAKAALENESHRDPDVVSQVAERISKIL